MFVQLEAQNIYMKGGSLHKTLTVCLGRGRDFASADQMFTQLLVDWKWARSW